MTHLVSWWARACSIINKPCTRVPPYQPKNIFFYISIDKTYDRCQHLNPHLINVQHETTNCFRRRLHNPIPRCNKHSKIFCNNVLVPILSPHVFGSPNVWSTAEKKTPHKDCWLMLSKRKSPASVSRPSVKVKTFFCLFKLQHQMTLRDTTKKKTWKMLYSHISRWTWAGREQRLMLVTRMWNIFYGNQWLSWQHNEAEIH